MPIVILSNTDPGAAIEQLRRKGAVETPSTTARTQARDVLTESLRRYCKSEIEGRSFLIAGSRGSGKTTLVDAALLDVYEWQQSLGLGVDRPMRPLPIYLEAQRIFLIEEDDPLKLGNSTPSDATKARFFDTERRTLVEATTTPVMVRDENLMQRTLVLSVLGLYRAIANEFSIRHWRRVDLATTDLAAKNLIEMAAQFEVEFNEGPSAARLREFWNHSGALESGVLHDGATQPDQGFRELVALVGITHAHQRVSGEIQQSDAQKSGSKWSRETSVGGGMDFATSLQPLMPVAAGTVAAAAASTGPAGITGALVLGIAATIGASLALKVNSLNSRSQERTLSTTFLPDLSATTLDRILPMLLTRLNDAGLAPIFIVDEFDKIDKLIERMVPLVNNLKKLYAESVLTCLLVDRSFFEELRQRDRNELKDIYFSYFSHRLFVTIMPNDLHQYLGGILAVSGSSAASTGGNQADILDFEVLKWWLLHQSRLNGLSLSRQLEEMRDADSSIRLDAGAVRSQEAYRVGVTLQVAIQLQLADPRVAAWLERHPDLRPTLLDALYFISRQRTRHPEGLRLDRIGCRRFVRDLGARMTPGLNQQPANWILDDADDGPETDQKLLELAGLKLDQAKFLFGLVVAMAHTLSPSATRESLADQFNKHDSAGTGRLDPLRPDAAVMDAILCGPASILS